MVGPWAGCSQEKFRDQEVTVKEILAHDEHGSILYMFVTER